MKMIDKVLAFATECGVTPMNVEKVGRIGMTDVYALIMGRIVDGIQEPTGLPQFITVNGDKLTYVWGDDALKLMSMLDE